jgi:diacylglycerol kinase (ATP)
LGGIFYLSAMKKPPFHKSVIYSIKGFLWMLKSERNFQLEVFALLINLVLIVYLQLTKTDTALILMVCFSVLITEIINTAIEKICDFVEPNFNEKIGLIKDLAAGAVILATLLSIIVGFLVYPKYVF